MPETTWGKKLGRLVGQRVQRLRRSASPKSLTQHELAAQTRNALSRSSIASIERGLQGISLVQLYVLADALDVDPVELLPSRAEVLPTPTPQIEELVRRSPPEVAKFLRTVQEGSVSRKGGSSA